MKTKINKTTFKDFENFADVVEFLADPQLSENEHIIKAVISRCKNHDTGVEFFSLTLDTFIGDLDELHKQNLENLQRKLGGMMH